MKFMRLFLSAAHNIYVKLFGRVIIMWFWNRREVYNGFSLKMQAEVREILKANNIKYDYRIININNSGRSRTGNFGINRDYETEYYIYVSKKDYEFASHLLGK